MRACGDSGKGGGGKEEQLTQRLTDGADDEEQSEQTGSDVVDTNRKGKKNVRRHVESGVSIGFLFFLKRGRKGEEKDETFRGLKIPGEEEGRIFAGSLKPSITRNRCI